MGIGVAANGDVWIADGSDNQLLFFPGGRIKDGRIVKVAGLKSPFDIVIDSQNRVWVSNSSVGHGCAVSPPMIRPRWKPSAPASAFAHSRWIRKECLGGEQYGRWTSRCRSSRRRLHHGAV